MPESSTFRLSGEWGSLRAVCPDCAADVPPGIACRAKCEGDVAALNVVIQRSKSAYQKTGAAYKRNAIATSIAGLVFFIVGLMPIILRGNYGSSFMAVLGLVFFLWAYFSYKNGKQIEGGDAQSSTQADGPASGGPTI